MDDFIVAMDESGDYVKVHVCSQTGEIIDWEYFDREVDDV
jgi:hypothetical protein